MDFHVDKDIHNTFYSSSPRHLSSFPTLDFLCSLSIIGNGLSNCSLAHSDSSSFDLGYYRSQISCIYKENLNTIYSHLGGSLHLTCLKCQQYHTSRLEQLPCKFCSLLGSITSTIEHQSLINGLINSAIMWCNNYTFSFTYTHILAWEACLYARIRSK